MNFLCINIELVFWLKVPTPTTAQHIGKARGETHNEYVVFKLILLAISSSMLLYPVYKARGGIHPGGNASQGTHTYKLCESSAWLWTARGNPPTTWRTCKLHVKRPQGGNGTYGRPWQCEVTVLSTKSLCHSYLSVSVEKNIFWKSINS